ncbi:MAG: histidine phosphatase family protein [Mangrovicoccus sp.]
MGDVYLVRHGQAQTGATDEAGYDRLSPLGHQQAEWLGAYLRETSDKFDRVICGGMRRQRETAEGLDLGPEIETDPRFKEIDYFTLAREMETRHDLAFPMSAEAFAAHVPPTFEAWQSGELIDAPESFSFFEDRIRQSLFDLAQSEERVLVVTSGGPIAMAMRILLDLGLVPMTRMLLATRNTSVHKVIRGGSRLHLSQFGAVPHLEHPDRAHARTYG